MSTRISRHVCAAALAALVSGAAHADGAFRAAATVTFADTRLIAAHVRQLAKGAPDALLAQAVPNAILNSPVARLLGPMRAGAAGVAVCYVDSAVVARLLQVPATAAQRKRRDADLERVKHWTVYYPATRSQAELLKLRPGIKVVQECLAVPPAPGTRGPIVYIRYSPDGRYAAVSVSPVLTRDTARAAAAALRRPLGRDLAFISMDAMGARALLQTDSCGGGTIAVRMGAAGLELDGRVRMPSLTQGVLPPGALAFANVPANAPLFGAGMYGQDIRGAEFFSIAGPEFGAFVKRSLAVARAPASPLVAYHLPAWKRPGRPAPKAVAPPRRRLAGILPEAFQRRDLANIMFCSPTEVFRQGLPRVAAGLSITEATKYEASIRLLKPVRGDGMGFMSWREGADEHFFLRLSHDELRGTAGFWSLLFL